jgi:hypothetical protein
MEFFGEDKASTSLHRIIHPSPSLRVALHFGIILHSYIVCQRGRESERALKTPFLAIHAKGGESVSPKQKDRTTTPISKLFGKLFSIWCFSKKFISIGIL